MLVLASSSPYRRALLERLRLPFEVVSPQVDESPRAGEGPRALALRLAEEKARAAALVRPRDLIIGSDQVATFRDATIGKPGTFNNALEQLRTMRGKHITFHTAVCLLDAATGASDAVEVPTTVEFRNFSDRQAARYLELDTPYDCAGSAKIESLGIALVERVESDDPTALIGLPLIALVGLLTHAGMAVL